MKRILAGLAIVAAALAVTVAPAQADDDPNIDTSSVSTVSPSSYESNVCIKHAKYVSGQNGTVNGQAIYPTSSDGSPSPGGRVRFVNNSRNNNGLNNVVTLNSVEVYRVAGSPSTSIGVVDCYYLYRGRNAFTTGTNQFYDRYSLGVRLNWAKNSNGVGIPTAWTTLSAGGWTEDHGNFVDYFPF